MFTTGRIIFAALFFIAFILLMIWSYKKDAGNHEVFYKNTAIKVAFYGTLIIAAFVIIGLMTKH
jgi:hypothetical protein